MGYTEFKDVPTPSVKSQKSSNPALYSKIPISFGGAKSLKRNPSHTNTLKSSNSSNKKGGKSQDFGRKLTVKPQYKMLLMGKKNISMNQIAGWGNKYELPLTIKFRKPQNIFSKKYSA